MYKTTFLHPTWNYKVFLLSDTYEEAIKARPKGKGYDFRNIERVEWGPLSSYEQDVRTYYDNLSL
jgi:hypothetical protein